MADDTTLAGEKVARLCGHDGGRGIGAGHVCTCVRKAGHPHDSDRPHGCSCGAAWANSRRLPARYGSCPSCGQRVLMTYRTEADPTGRPARHECSIRPGSNGGES